MRVKPTDWHYTMAGLFLAIPGGTSTDNHGLAFAGAHPAYRNGIWAIGETALTPKIGPSKLPGKYAFGGYYFGLKNTDFQGQPREGRYGFYWQVDQMLWREPIPTLPPPPIADGKTIQPSKNVKTVVPTSKLSDQGLSFFAWFNYAPKYNNIMPFYFHTGLIYKGLIPTRDEDQIGAGIAYSNYSIDQIRMVESRGGNPLTYQAEVEFDYRIQVNKWAYVQPFLQYLIRPAANTTVHNATVLGVNVGINF